MGGYADVTTNGPPDRLLPSQFALDEWDFLRRYADHELLYFRREEPHTRTRHELVCCWIRVCVPGATCGWYSEPRLALGQRRREANCRSSWRLPAARARS